MCKATLSSETARKGLHDGGFHLWPLQVPVAIGLMAVFLPSSQYLNRGFTVWFHLVALLYGLTQSKFIVRFQALIGISICAGWYAALIYDYFEYGNFFLILYRNMPEVMKKLMFSEDTTLLNLNSWECISTMLLSHVLDTLGHPLLTWYFLRQHQKQGGTFVSLLTWDTIVSTWLFSRCWSLTHTFHNFGSARPYYFGYDVYVIDEGTLDLWYPAYIVEILFYSSMVLWKILGQEHIKHKTLERPENEFQKKPSLLWSESSISQNSTPVQST